MFLIDTRNIFLTPFRKRKRDKNHEIIGGGFGLDNKSDAKCASVFQYFQ